MDFLSNSTEAAASTGGAEPTQDVLSTLFHYTFDEIAPAFQACHKDIVSVGLHMITTPIGMIGAMSLLRLWTKGSSSGVFVFFCYLLSLLPALSNGVYIGTFIMCFLIMQATRVLKLGASTSVALVALSYALQDLAHLGKLSVGDNVRFITITLTLFAQYSCTFICRRRRGDLPKSVQ